ncbi:MAG: nucleoside triphosphate pyrophosphohydrolase [Gammaproteobacteria bacterium]
MPNAHNVADLLHLMARLRDPDTGCPWDRAQDFRSIAPCTLEEVCEVIDAIERDDYPHLREELGDLLFQVVFYAQLGSERGLFDFAAIVDGLVAKLVARHPHVFPAGTLASRRGAHEPVPETRGVKQLWESIKERERAARGSSGPLGEIPTTLSALMRSAKVQKRAAHLGFDWPDAAPVPAKIREELAEVEAAVATGVRADITEEIGDLLFACVNLARHLGIDSEAALRGANRKFERRFEQMVARMDGDADAFRALGADEKEALWQAVKQTERDAPESAAKN